MNYISFQNGSKKNIFVSTSSDDAIMSDFIDGIINEQADFFHRIKQFVDESSFQSCPHFFQPDSVRGNKAEERQV